MPSEKDRLGKLAKTLFAAETQESEEQRRENEPVAQNDPWDDSLRLGRMQPRISFVSPKAKAILTYLRKTTPEFNISKVTAVIVEQAMKEKYPALWRRID